MHEDPFFVSPVQGKKVTLNEKQTIGEMLSQLASSVTLKTYDDAVIASTNKVSSLLSLPYFKLRLDNE